MVAVPPLNDQQIIELVRLAATRRRTTGYALQARPVAHQREVPASVTGVAGVALHPGFFHVAHLVIARINGPAAHAETLRVARCELPGASAFAGISKDVVPDASS